MKLVHILCFFLLPSIKALGQYTWDTYLEFPNEDSLTTPLVWNYKEKLWLFTDEKGLKSYSKAENDLIVSFTTRDNRKPAHRKEAMQWTSAEGLWLFGGISTETHELLNDLWMYRPEKDLWELIRPEGEVPSERRGSGHWKDGKGRLWLFGGVVKEAKDNALGLSNELWFFDIDRKVWGKAELKEKPSARANMAVWETASGEVLLYGGFGYSEDGSRFGGLSDLWKFDPEAGAWMSTTDRGKSIGRRSFGTGESPIHPGQRIKPVSWTDKEGFCWLTLGQSLISQERVSVEPYLWRLNPREMKWSYFFVDPQQYIVEAVMIFQNQNEETLMVFPSYVNGEREVLEVPSVNLLNPAKK